MQLEDKVGYISPSACVTLIDVMGSDARVVNAARVSFNKWICEDVPLEEKDKKLIAYLAEHEHNSPFCHPMVCLRIKMPLFVAREWYRHTVGFTRNEVSRRYVDGPVECFLPQLARERSPKLKQGSASDPVSTNVFCLSLLENTMTHCVNTYRSLLGHGVCPELARTVLPQSMMTEFIETASLSAYARLCSQRLTSSAQLEIREYAKEIDKLMRKEFPVSWATLLSAVPDADSPASV